MPAPCSLLLEVFTPISIYEGIETLEWEVSTDPDHAYPYLIAPRNYAEQEIDPIRCAASIGTVEIGVIDVPEIAGEQSSGWMTARIHDILGRRCRLSRWINEDLGWTVIADGPAGTPKLDSSYAAYRWSIRDTRETERKLAAFHVGGSCAIVPRGPIYGFGTYTEGEEDVQLLDSLLHVPFTGKYNLTSVGPNQLGLVNLAAYFAGGTLSDVRLVMDKAAQDAIQISEIVAHKWGARYADVLWRVAGDTPWNVARPLMPANIPQPFVGTAESVVDGETVTALNYVTLFLSPHIPEGFPTENDIDIEVIIRYRGPASEAFPYYVEGRLGDVLQAIYSAEYSLAPTRGITGVMYDPAEIDSVEEGFLSRIHTDPIAFDALTEQVMLRQTEPVPDVRAWAEDNLYAPSGWIPALDSDMQVSPVSRDAPESIEDLPSLTDATVSPTPNWQKDNTVSQIIYTYKRFYLPADEDVTTARAADGLAIRDITIEFQNPQSELRYGAQIETYNADAFGSVGTFDGLVRSSPLPETGSLLAQAAKFNVLDRYKNGVQSISIPVRRYQVPNIRVGSWVTWNLMHLPSAVTGQRGSEVFAAQVVSIRDDDCVWRDLVLEESGISSAPPGMVTFLRKSDDQPSAGGIALRVVSDVEHT